MNTIPIETLPKSYAEILRSYANEVEKNEQLMIKNKEMQTKAMFADSVAESEQSILIGEFAKFINDSHFMIGQNKFMIGQNRLFVWFRENRYLHSTGQQYNEPLQRYIDLGLFEKIESIVKNPDDSFMLVITTKVTSKGQIYFMDQLKGEYLESLI